MTGVFRNKTKSAKYFKANAQEMILITAGLVINTLFKYALQSHTQQYENAQCKHT